MIGIKEKSNKKKKTKKISKKEKNVEEKLTV